MIESDRYWQAFTDAIGQPELAADERIVCRNDHWVALVPWWAVWPFELMLIPVRRVADLPSLEGAERDALADIGDQQGS